ncbi:MAG TPA: amino acid permease, partial [Vicinamibacteria bacterium]|nr:amino acid permease [Vicinamibacteria bacterium]
MPAVCLIVGQVIGIGIFLTPADMARKLGAPGLTYAMWLLAGVMALTGGLCYGELASRFPEAGGAYVYLREAWGETPAFLYGWKCLLVLDPGLTAALAAGLAEYVGYLAPLGATGRKGVAVLVVLVIAVLSILGTRIAAGTLVAVTALKLGILGLVIVSALASGRVEAARILPSFAREPGSPPLLAALAGGFVAAFFSFAGWWEVARMAGEVRDPQRTLPRAFVAGIAIVTATYVLTSMAFMGALPAGETASADAFVARLGELLFGAFGGRLLAFGVVVSVLGSVTAVMLSAPRVYLALASDGLFPTGLARLHPRLGTPVAAIALQAALACLLIVVGTFSDIVAYFIFVTVAFIGASVAGLYRLAPPESGYRTPMRLVTPAVFVGLSALLLVMLLAGRPVQALSGLAVVAA